jgi:imidazolonepropionase-like amidohydrolase
VDARGKYLIPGLWDMHAHTEAENVDDDAAEDAMHHWVYPLFVANGVTGIREMAQRWPHGTDSFRVWRREISSGARVGPRLIGPSFDMCYWEGRQGNNAMPTPEAARRIMDSLKTAGTVFVKIHGCISEPDNFFAIAAAARRAGLPIVGHIPTGVNDIEASDSGLRSVEHVESNHQCWPDWPTPLDSAEAETRCAPVAQAYVRNGTWMSTTLAGAKWVDQNVSEAQRFVRMMYRLGVRRFLAGTDWGTGYMSSTPDFRPGVSAVEDVMLLGEALSPLEGLRAGTLNPAKFFDATDSLGTVAPGKLADLILLDADPLADIHNVMRLHAVVANGRYFDRAALDALLADGKKQP